MKKINSFYIALTKKLVGYVWMIAAFQDFKVFLLLPNACEDFDRVFANEK